ncbi:MAG: hypothetical protein WKF96_00270 [Solirubrobacteraceae bacterium]
MTWVRLDDRFHGHPKVVTAGLAAAGLYCSALSYCGAYETDGKLPIRWAHGQADDAPELAQRLVDVGLWRREGLQYVIPDFLEFNPSREEVAADREARKTKASRAAKARWGDRREAPGDA